MTAERIKEEAAEPEPGQTAAVCVCVRGSCLLDKVCVRLIVSVCACVCRGSVKPFCVSIVTQWVNVFCANKDDKTTTITVVIETGSARSSSSCCYQPRSGGGEHYLLCWLQFTRVAHCSRRLMEAGGAATRPQQAPLWEKRTSRAAARLLRVDVEVEGEV